MRRCIAVALLLALRCPASGSDADTAPIAPTPTPTRAQQLAALETAAGDDQVSALTVATGLANCQPSAAEALAVLRRLLARPADGAKGYALQALVALGPASAPCADAVLALLLPAHSPSCRAQALAALAAMHLENPRIEPVLACLRDPQVPRGGRASAAALLGSWGPRAASAGPTLLQLIDDTDGGLALAATLATAAITPTSTPAPLRAGVDVSALAAACAHLPTPVSASVADALADVAEHDPRHGVRLLCWQALRGAGLPTPASVSAGLRTVIGSDLLAERLSLAALSGDGGPGVAPTPEDITVLAQQLDAAPAAADASARALAHLGAAAAAAASELAAALTREPARTVPRLALLFEAMRACGHQQVLAMAVASELPANAAIYAGRTHDQASAIQAMLFATLVAVGVPAVADRDVLAALATPDPGVPALPEAAAQAAGSLGAGGAFAVPALRAIVADATGDVAVPALSSFERLRQSRHGAPAPLGPHTQSLRACAIEALGQIGPPAASAAADLRALADARLPGAGNAALLQVLARQALDRITTPKSPSGR